jgi:hypothetical protein
MKRTQRIIHGVCLSAFTFALLPGLSGCGETGSTEAVAKPDQAKFDAANAATAAAAQEAAKAKKK